jgi:CrcB protein
LHYIIVGLGGILGSITRYKLGKIISERSDSTFPIGTFIINISGALLLGIVSRLGLSRGLYALFGDGFLGAYTTFSTFMYEGFNLFQENEILNALTYIGLSMILGVAF